MSLFETPRLVIREWTDDPADLARIYDIYSRWEVARWLGTTPRAMTDPAEAARAVERWRERYAAHGGRYGCWAIVPRGERVPVGSLLLVPLPNGDGEIEVGWHLHPDAWGNGYATEAARGALARAFAAGLPAVYAVVRPDNAPSQAVCRRLGMTPLGVTDRWYGVPVQAFRLDRPAADPDGPAGDPAGDPDGGAVGAGSGTMAP